MKKTTLFILLFSIFCSGELLAQTDYYSVITGLSTSGNGRAPQGSQRYNRSVWLITAAELAANGFTTGTVVNSLGFNYLTAQSITTTGTMVIYLENTADATNLKSTTWATAITGMTTVSNGNITVPNATGTYDIPFAGGSPFTYTGGGLYIAFDYQNVSGTLSTANVAACNTALTGGLKGAISTTANQTTLVASNFRPETRLGTPVTCTRVDYVDQSNTTTTSVDLFWNSLMVTNSDMEYGVYGYTQGTGTMLPNITQTYTLSGLSPSTVYDCYVRNNCLNATSSIWNGPFPFNTQFLPANPTYSTSFEQETFPFLGWVRPSGTPAANDWQFGAFGLPSVTNTLTQDGKSSIYSLSAVTATPANNWIISRGLNLTAGSTVTISFYTRNYQAASSVGTSSYNVTVGTAQNVAAQTTAVGSEVNNASATWVQKSYNYTPPSSGVYYFGIQNVSAANTVGQQALFLDNLTVSQVLSTTDFLLSKIAILPNPAKDLITISNDINAIISTVQMMDLNGRVVKNQALNAIQGQVAIGDLATGVYMVKVTTDQGTVTKKIVKE